jgi:hypothetical protein
MLDQLKRQAGELAENRVNQVTVGHCLDQNTASTEDWYVGAVEWVL